MCRAPFFGQMNEEEVHATKNSSRHSRFALQCRTVSQTPRELPAQLGPHSSSFCSSGRHVGWCAPPSLEVSPGVNNNQPFIRFLIFGPSGQLLPSINLDGRREKFVPGTCVVCHGGDHCAGKFPDDGTG